MEKFGPKAYDRRTAVVLRIAWCERWLAGGHKQLTPEWENLLEDARWLLAELERNTDPGEDGRRLFASDLPDSPDTPNTERQPNS